MNWCLINESANYCQTNDFKNCYNFLKGWYRTIDGYNISY